MGSILFILFLLYSAGVIGTQWYRKVQYPKAYWFFDNLQFWSMFLMFGWLFSFIFA